MHTQSLLILNKKIDTTDMDPKSNNKWEIVIITDKPIQQEMISSMISMRFSEHFLVWMECKWIETEVDIEQRNIFRKLSFTYQTGAAPGNQAHAQRNQGIGIHYLFILIFLFYAIAPLFKSAPYHSFTLDSQYRFKVNSDLLQTQYYVRE